LNVDLARKQVSKSDLFLSYLSWQTNDERLGLVCDEPVQDRFNFFQSRKLVQTCSIATQLARRLWSTQHQNAHQSRFRWTQVHHFRHHVLVLRHAARAAVENIREVLLTQALHGVSHLALSV